MTMFGGGFSASKVKPRLKMAVHRLQINSNKKVALMKQQKREIAKLLAEEPLPKEEKARIRAEALIRDDNTVEAYEILQLECELIHERIKLIDSMKHCPADMVSCISTIMYASDRVDVPELNEIRKQFRAKYGKDFEKDAMTNEGGILNERVVAKLSVHPPTAILVNAYLEKIAEEFEVSWKPKPLMPEQQMAPYAGPIGDSVGIAAGSGLGRAVTGISQASLFSNPNKYREDKSTTSRGGDDDQDSFGGGTSASGMGSGRGSGGGGGISVQSHKSASKYNGIPIVQATKYNPPTASAPSARNVTEEYGRNENNEEEDMPYAPQGSKFTVADESSDFRSSQGNENADGSGQDNKGQNGDDDYDALAARFANLKR